MTPDAERDHRDDERAERDAVTPPWWDRRDARRVGVDGDEPSRGDL